MGAGNHQAARVLCCLASAALCGCAGTGGSTGITAGGAASCAAPILTTLGRMPLRAAPPRVISVSPGQKLRLYGYWYQTCHDTNHEPPAHPYRQLTILVIQGHSRLAVATAHPSQRKGDFSVLVRFPASLHPGTATIRTSLMAEKPVQLRVRARAAQDAAS